ncbi:hypothetical protein [Bailinhaonella thermotolerans]|uniref:Integral membrane protein n=1 Tax=Bailinhaonella thermotolerans TaxID=1070861 RepID=A0A3A4B8F9_9ACTN|nr:hypothetical protein [Bailinhaonella thermotolerans]RJL30408.1 hypothetical protein D5H75_22820 [Bailinhaonella thermotolerans]
MTGPLATGVIVASLVIAAFCLVTTVMKKSMNMFHLVALAALEIALLVLAGIGIAQAAGGNGPAELATFIGYLVGVLLIPPAAAFWGLIERSRWGPAVIMVACLAVPVMIARLQQIWQGTGV